MIVRRELLLKGDSLWQHILWGKVNALNSMSVYCEQQVEILTGQ